MDIFSFGAEEEINKVGPLALRLRPESLDEFIGQEHLVGDGKPLKSLIEKDILSSMIFYGPPGSGKTTLAEIVRHKTNAAFIRINAVSSSVAQLREIIAEARNLLALNKARTILFIDEIHRFNKAQQDALLPAAEKGVIILIGATTENPCFTVNAPLLSRMRIFEFKPLSESDIAVILDRSLVRLNSDGAGVTLSSGAKEHIIRMANGDARSALNALETAMALCESKKDGILMIDTKTVEEAVQKKAVLYDRNSDAHYDIISAFIKSIRGSDPNAALYWLAMMIEAGEDPLFIARRLIIAASEDIGNADPHALLVSVATMQALQLIGMPEGRITLAQATCYLATAPKSNASYIGVEEALVTVRERSGDRVPVHLRDSSYKSAKYLNHGKGYLYPHNYKGNYVVQDYLPQGMKRKQFYRPRNNGYERTIKERMERLEQLLSKKGGQND